MKALIEELQNLLTRDSVPFEKVAGRCQIIIKNEQGERLCDCVEIWDPFNDAVPFYLEIMGALTEEETEEDDIFSVLPHLTPEEVAHRFEYCYRHNTAIYREE